jgi:hypothetical protein
MASAPDPTVPPPPPPCGDDAAASASGHALLGIGLGLVSQVLTSLGLCIMKWAHMRNDALPPHQRGRLFVVGGFAVNALGGLMQAIALTMAPQSVISALAPVVLVANVAFAPCLLGETVQPQHLRGTAVVGVATVVVVAAGQSAADACDDGDFGAEELVYLLHRGPHLVFAAVTIVMVAIAWRAVRRAELLVDLDMRAAHINDEVTPFSWEASWGKSYDVTPSPSRPSTPQLSTLVHTPPAKSKSTEVAGSVRESLDLEALAVDERLGGASNDKVQVRTVICPSCCSQAEATRRLGDRTLRPTPCRHACSWISALKKSDTSVWTQCSTSRVQRVGSWRSHTCSSPQPSLATTLYLPR